MSDNISNNTNKLEELSKMKVNDLKKELKSRGLSTVGNKQELIDRMINHSESSDIEDTVLDEDNILDEDDGLEDDFGDSDIDDSKVLGEVAEKDTNLGNGIADKNNEQIVQPKKVTLKRNSVTNLNGDSKPKEEEEKTETIENDEQDRVIKLDDVQTLSQTERIQMRAKKFGGNTVPEDKKLARLIKFGPVTEQKPVTSIDNDKLKQRAERFGETVSKTLHDNEKEDKLKARELRFGTIDKTVLTAIKKRNTGENGGKQKNSRGGRRSFPYKKRY